MFGRHKNHQLASQNSTLQLLKICSSRQALEASSPSSLSSSTFFKVLTSKNRRMKAQAARREGNSIFSIDYRVRQELDIVKEELAQQQKLFPKTQIKDTSTREEASRLTVRTSLPLAREGVDLVEVMKRMSPQISDLANKLGVHWKIKQNYEQLLNCFKYMLDDQEKPIFSKEELIPSEHSTKDYQQLFKQLQDTRSTSQFLASCFQALACNSSILPSSAQLNKFFTLILFYMRKSITVFEDQPFATTLNEFQTLQKYFEDDRSEEGQRFEGRLQQALYWRKMVFLLSRSTQFQKLIEVHLRQHSHHSLLQYFSKVIKGQKAEYQLDPWLYEHNEHYRQFVLILQRKWTPSTAQYPAPRELIASVIKQLQLKVLFHQNYQIQQEFLKKYALQLTQRLQNQIYNGDIQPTLALLITDLLNLGQFSKVLAILQRSSKIDAIEALLSISILFSLHLSRCQLILYSHQQTIVLLTKLLEKIFSSPVSEFELIKLLSTFHPLIRLLPNSTSMLVHILSIKDSLLSYVLNEPSSLGYLQTIGLNLENIPYILQSLAQKHANYQYCAMVAMSTCVQVPSILEMSHRESPLPRNPVRSQQVLSQSQHLHQVRNGEELFQKFQGIECSHLPYERRLRVLAKFIELLIIRNVQLCFQAYSRKKHAKAALKASHLICLLLQKTYRPLFNQEQQAINPSNHNFSIIQVPLRALRFACALLTLKQHISSSSYQSVVSVLNHFLEEIAPHYQTIHRWMSETLGSSALELAELFCEWTVQGVLVLREYEPKLVKLNELLFKEVIRRLMGIVRRLRQLELQMQEVQGGRERYFVQEQLEKLQRNILQ